MRFIRKFLLGSALVLLPGLLFATAFDIGILQTVGNPKPVKKLLTDSGIYTSIVPALLEQTKQVSGPAGEISLNNPDIKAAAESSFNPKLVQDSSEKIIDGTYAWLKGKTNEPNFDIDLSRAKSDFATKIGTTAEARAASLPACSLRSLPTSTDPFSINCLPRSVTATQVGIQAQNSVLQAEDFLKDPHITAGDFKAEGSDQSIFSDNLRQLPHNYRRAKATPIILIFLTLLAMAAVIFLSDGKRRGLKRVGIILLVAAIALLALAWGMDSITTDKLVPDIKSDNAVLQSKLQVLVSDIVHNVDKHYRVFAGVYGSLGIAALAIAKFVHKKPSTPVKISTKV